MRTIVFREVGQYPYTMFEAAFKPFVHQNDWILDIGSNIGAATAPLSDLTGPGGRVICFEPNPFFVEEAKYNLRHRNNIDFHAVACSYDYGKLDYYYAYDNGQIVDPQRNFCVDIVPLYIRDNKTKLVVDSIDTNDFLQTHYAEHLHKIRFVKIDTEKYDCHIIKNLKPFLSKYKPVIEMEWFVHNSHVDDLFNLAIIQDSGYAAYQIRDNVLCKVYFENELEQYRGQDFILIHKETQNQC